MEKVGRVEFGKTGIDVSRVCLGTMLMGSTIGRDESFRVLDDFVARGGDFLDTANCYAWWVGKGEFIGDESEALLGEWLRARGNRDRVFLATKVGARLRDPSSIRGADGIPRWAEVPANYEGASRKVILDAVDASLRRLKTDYIDLYYVHVDDRSTRLEETMETLNSLVVAGKVRYLGYSNARTWRLERIKSLCEKNGWAQPVAVQSEYSFLRPAAGADLGISVHADDEFFDWLGSNPGMTLLAYSPLLKGIYADPEKRKAYYNWSLYDTQDSAARLARLDVLAKTIGVDGNALVLAWMLHLKPAVIPILGFSRFAQYEDNIRALDVHLDAAAMDFLNGK